ncbi:hypothetical protein [Aurantiacibacter luteus]|uniref:hypothetical protein n=1 Tax=Aurantiacibacter luteus TaxID=1581420 RepID=UPI00069C2F40|nr:hypothetical protein [Aurantiacibacter luteus]
MPRPLIAATAALAAFTAPLPAFAQDDAAIAEAVEQLDDPAVQEQMSLVAATLVGALMEMRVAPLMEAMDEMSDEPRPRVDPDARVADLVGPEAAEMPARVAERMPRMLGAMSAMAGAFGEMLPHLREVGARMEERMNAQMAGQTARDLPESD